MMAEHVNPSSATPHLVLFGISDRGLQRENNEDHFMVVDLTRKMVGVHDNQLRPELLHHAIGAGGTMLLVADGLGGHEGGEIASQLAVETVAQALIAMAGQGRPMAEQLVQAVEVAHEAICKYHGATGRARHMASTLTAVHVGPDVMTLAQIGDSRAYRLSRGKLTQLTEDQTIVHMMQKKGMLTPEEAQNHPHRNIILQALGQDKAVCPELQTLPWQHDDCLLLCSDGLSSYVDHTQIEAIMASGEDEHIRCRKLVEAANGAGGADNVTVLLARVLAKDESHPGERTGAHPPAPPAVERPRKSIWTTDIKLPSFRKTPPQAEPPLADKEPHTARTLVMRAFWQSKEVQAPAESAHASGPHDRQPAAPKPSIWRRELKWPWSSKAQPSSPPDTARPAAGTHAGAWEPDVLKALEGQLARYIGPVAKVLVGRAAQRTKDFSALCQELAAQLPSAQARDSFLRSVTQELTAQARRS